MRPLWFVAGAGAGVYVMLKARRAAEALTPEGLSDRLAGLQLGWEMFTDEVRTGMAEAETDLRQRVGQAAGDEQRQLSAGSPGDVHDVHDVHDTSEEDGSTDGLQ